MPSAGESRKYPAQKQSSKTNSPGRSCDKRAEALHCILDFPREAAPSVMPEKKLTLHILDDKFTISRLAQFAELPMIVAKGEMCFSARTDEELVIITPEFMAPNNVQQEVGWRAMRVVGESALNDGKVISSVIGPLGNAGIAPFVITTFNTVYVFLREEKIVDAVKALQHAGHTFEHKEVAVPK